MSAGDPPTTDSVPTSIAAIMAAIRHDMAAPTNDANDDPAERAAAPVPPATAGPAVPDGRSVSALPDGLDAEARALLGPLLKAWLDANLPEIVETAVHAELRRLTGLH